MKTTDKDSEEDDFEIDFPFETAWYVWALLVIGGLLYAVFILPFLWVKDRICSFFTQCRYAIAIHSNNQL